MDVDDTQAKDMDMKDERLNKSIENVRIYHKYIQTEIDHHEGCKQNPEYTHKECWINALVDSYEGTDLMRVQRGKLKKNFLEKKF